MPFFCDLYEFSSSTGNSKTSIPPELIPYTQTLYYNCSTDYGTQDYKELFSAPWSGNSIERTAQMGLNWSSDIGQFGLQKYSDSTHGSRTDAQVGWRNRRIQLFQNYIEDLAKGGHEIDLTDNSPTMSTLRIFFGTMGFDDEFAKFQRTVGGVKKKANQIKSAVDNFLDGFLKRNPIEKSSTTNTVPDNAKQNADSPLDNDLSYGFLLNPDNLVATLNSITVNYGGRSAENLAIEKSIVCKDSSVQTAAECIKKLASYLAIVAPNFYYQSDQDTWSKAAMYYTAPNSFAIKPVDKNTVASGGFKTNTSKEEGKPVNFDLFKYRGELQLRQGYSIYRNLVPKQVTITASSDMLLLESDPFQDLGSDTSKDRAKSNSDGNADSTLSFVNYKASTQQDPAQKFIDAWKKSNLCRKVTLYGSKNNTATNTSATTAGDSSDQLAQYREGWLFPQWINIDVELCNVEPYDGFTATQQLFCFADGCVKTNTGG